MTEDRTREYTVWAMVALVVSATSAEEARDIASDTDLSEWGGFEIESVDEDEEEANA